MSQSFYDPKRPPSVPPSYLSRSPIQDHRMPYPVRGNQQTPYQVELGDLSERAGVQSRPVDELRDDHQAWKYNADTYFQHRPPPPSSLEKIYKTFCCGSRVGFAAWLVALVLLIAGLIVAIYFGTRSHAVAQPDTKLAASSSSVVISATTAISTVTITPTLPTTTSTSTSASTSLQVSTVTTISISTYYSSPPSTVTATTVATTTATETETTTATTQSVTTTTSIISGTIITETETNTQTSIALSTLTTTQPTTILTTLLTTLTTIPQVSTVVTTVTPLQASTVTATTVSMTTATSVITTISVSTTTTSHDVSTTVTDQASTTQRAGGGFGGVRFSVNMSELSLPPETTVTAVSTVSAPTDVVVTVTA